MTLELFTTLAFLGIAIGAAFATSSLRRETQAQLDYYRHRAYEFEGLYDGRVDRINALEADLKKLHAAISAKSEASSRELDTAYGRCTRLEDELGTSQAALRNATETVWDIEGALEKASIANRKLYDLIVTVVNGDAQAARKASEDAVERFLKIAEAAERRAGEVTQEAMSIIGGSSDGEDECECCREKRRQDRQGLGGRTAPQPGDAGGLLRDGGQRTWWRSGVRQPGGQAHQVHQHGPGGAAAANPVDGADDDAYRAEV